VRRYVWVVAIITLFAVPSAFAGQDKPELTPLKPTTERPAPPPVQVQVVISRYRDDKKVASTPYLLSVPLATAAGGQGQLQIGGQVPVPAGNGPGVQYRNVGTSINVTVRPSGDSRYEVTANVSESSVAGEGQSGLAAIPGVAPVLKTYTSGSTLVLRDGQTAQFNAATDPITGETVRVDVTLTVVNAK
jgi:hypothetical protein